MTAKLVSFLKSFFLILMITLPLLEVSSIAVQFFHNFINARSDATSDDVLTPELKAELRQAHKFLFYPSRWYTAQPNFRGKFVQTDTVGFRIDSSKLKGEKAIGFFGGSTMFSTWTNQAGTIPANVNIKGFESLNFGIGGYSTTAEIMAFIEATRLYPKISIVAFYDGVNEVARHLELVQDTSRRGDLYTKIGYYFRSGVDMAVSNEADSLTFSYSSSFLHIIRRLISAKKLQDYQQQDLVNVAREIVNIYYANIDDIKRLAESKGIVPIFFWQPSVFTTKKNLTDREMKFADDRSMIRKLYPLVTTMILSDPRRRGVNIYDLTEALDQLQGEVFYDWCHINERGNAVIGEVIENRIAAMGI